jgi:putative two-component system response regulator
MLAVASEAKDADTGQHVRRIQAYAHALARRLGMGDDEAEEIGYSAVLHDVGKIHVPDEILKKPGSLNDDERRRMQEHTIVGERILGTGTFFVRARRIARSHHENWDGSGYPDALAGRAIPLEARIVHLADVYDALVHERVYKPAWSPDDAARAIRDARGWMFEPDLVDAFLDLHTQGQWTPLAAGNGHPTTVPAPPANDTHAVV